MLKVWLQNATVRGFLHSLSGNAFFTISQGLQFLMLARGLGPTEFGRLAAANSITALLMPFSSLGASNVMIMRSTRDPSVLPVYLGNALLVMLASGSMLILLAALVAHTWLHEQVPVPLVMVLATSELLAFKAIEICCHAFVAREQLRYTSQFLGVQSALRLTFAAAFVGASDSPTATEWAWWALLSNGLASCWVLRRTIGLLGRPRAALGLARKEFATGASFAVGISAKSFYTDADKLFLARYAGAEVVGQYTVAFRVIQIVLTPVRALSFVMQARLFRAGEAGINSSLRVTSKLLGPLALAAGVLAVGFYFGAPLLTLVAGSVYSGSVDVLRTLSLLPLLLSIQGLLHDTLASSSYQRVAAVSQVVAALLICALCVALIPRFGWHGAAIATYASQIVLSLALGMAIYHLRRRPADASGGASA